MCIQALRTFTALGLLVSVNTPTWAEERSWNFDDTPAGKLPEGFRTEVGEWKVMEAEKAPSGKQVLAQIAKSPGPDFNLLLITGTRMGDVDLSVKMMAVSGKSDQGGGLVWRARDKGNYYIARYNPLEENFRVYKVENGKRSREFENAEIKAEGGWHTLRVTMKGDRIECFLDGKKYLEATDGTFKEPGMLGLWTKADAVTHFDDLRASDGVKTALDARKIGEAAGTEASAQPDGVVRISWARKDVPVKVDGLVLDPFAGLTSWAAFTPAPGGAMVMGDTVVFEDEVTPAMDAAFARGLEVSALHNHFFFDDPKVYFMHIGGMGAVEELAAGVRAVWEAIRKVRSEKPEPARAFPGKTVAAGNLDAGEIERTLGQKAQAQAGVVKVTIGRAGEMHGVKVAGSMGLTTWAAFSGGGDLAAVDGDFIMTAGEVQPVLRALRKSGMHVVALHNHMIGERPAFYFTHFWAKGPAKELAQGIRNVLDAQAAAERERADH